MSGESSASKAARLPAALGRLSSRLGPMLAPRMSGYVDRIAADEAFGWAFDAGRPERRVLVVATVRGRVVGEALADLPRRDLQASGKGDGRCGFRIRLPAGMSAEEAASLRIEAVVGLGRREIKKSARFKKSAIASSNDAAAVDDKALRTPAVGFLERCSDEVLKGWAVNPNDPDTPAKVDVFDGERFLGSATAEIERPRLRETNAPYGARGFEFVLPTKGVPPERLRARVAGTRIDLRRSRGYLGEPGPADRPEPSTPTIVPPRPIPRRGAVYLICGRGSAEAVARSVQSCIGIDPGAKIAVVAAAGPPPGVQHIGPADDAAFASLVREAEIICLLEPGQTATDALASALRGLEPATDVLTWPIDGSAGAVFNPEHAIWLGRQPGGLALRGHVVSTASGFQLSALAKLGPAAALTWVLGRGLSWADAPNPLASPPKPATELKHPLPRRCRRLSIAFWGVAGQRPEDLDQILSAAAGFETEILATDEVARAILTELQHRPAEPHESLAVRIVDSPAEWGPVALWSALGQAATGQTVLYCHGSARPRPEALREAAQWALEPGVGAVSIGVGDDAPAEASMRFMAVSRVALAEVGRFDHRLEPAQAISDVVARLGRIGRRSVELPAHDTDRL